MAAPRVPLYERLPEIYRIRDQEQQQPDQLKAYLALVERAFGAVHENIEQLYHDLFIETCDDWVIAYLADLLGTSHLSGDPWTLRADVADTIALRRRKGTLGAIELLTFNLTRWGVHAVELRESLAWQQHLNHQRPDAGGAPAYGGEDVTRHTVIRGGTATIRDPATLSLIGTPFDPFAHLPDMKPPRGEAIRYNLPNLAIFLWRLAAYRLEVSEPPVRGDAANTDAVPGPLDALFYARFDAHPKVEDGQPVGEPVRLFNTYRFDPDRRPPVLTELDETPGPIPMARLDSDAVAGNPEAYVSVQTYDETAVPPPDFTVTDVGLQFHLPQTTFSADGWRFRGANLCAWEEGLDPPLRNREIAIDPRNGRFVIGVMTEDEVTALQDFLRIAFTYGAVGPVGAHPVSRPGPPEVWEEEPTQERSVNGLVPGETLEAALGDIEDLVQPLVVTINDSLVHDLDLDAVSGRLLEGGEPNLSLNRSLIIRAASGQRPTIRLARPLRFRPTNVTGADPDEQADFNAVMDRLTVRLEGLYVTRSLGFDASDPLITRAALHRLEVIGCTLDPGGFRQLDGDRADIRLAMALADPFGFDEEDDETNFEQSPEVLIQRSITGPLRIDDSYSLELADSIVDAAPELAEDPEDDMTVTSASDPNDGWGPATQVSGATLFGRTRALRINGQGGIFTHSLRALDNQHGCLKFSYFSGINDRLPQNHACVTAQEAKLRFTSRVFGEPAYGQIALTSDFRILERGPHNDQMGAFGFLTEAHKWRNLQIRYREFMPVGIRPIPIAVT